MFSESADHYDLIYRTIKDFQTEAARIADLVRTAVPRAASVLDVACGTGEHALLLRSGHGFAVDGIDLNPRFVELARAKNAGGDFRVADMVEFDLARRYDAVLCLFGSIGYVCDVARLGRALDCMARHVAPEGVLLLEPWFRPGTLEQGHVSSVTAQGDGVTVCRVGLTEIDGRTARIRFEYVVGTSDGLRRASEVHELGLFDRDEMEGAFRRPGFEPAYDPEGLMGRGLYVAQRVARAHAES